MAAQALLDEVQPHLGFDQGEFTMVVMDLPDVPPQYAEIVIAQAAQAQPGNTKTDRTIGVCHLLENPPDSPLTAANSLSPVASVWGYLKDQEHRTIDEAGFLAAKMTLLQAPEHGVLEMGTRGAQYHPAPEYYGPDRATFLVEIGGLKVKVMYFFQVMGHVGGNDAYDPYQDKTLCPNGVEWKISLNPDDPNSQLLTFNNPTQLTSYLAGAVNVDIKFADLPAGAVCQTTGTTITLDDNAAGNGWFIDTTPGDNAEFLPTHNPNEWIAKAGSAADGKLDMLSVLLHEYGHVLGIDHSHVGWGPAPPFLSHHSPNPLIPFSDGGSCVPQAGSYHPRRT